MICPLSFAAYLIVHYQCERICNPLRLIEDRLRKTAIFQWNARVLQSQKLEFRQFMYAHQFPIININEPGLPLHFKLFGYEVFSSSRSQGIIRLMLALRKELAYAVHQVQPHPHIEYACDTAK